MGVAKWVRNAQAVASRRRLSGMPALRSAMARWGKSDALCIQCVVTGALNLAKVGGEGSNPFGRSSFSRKSMAFADA